MAINKKILIIDDDPESRKTLSDLLRIKGYFPVTAAQGESGLGKLEQEQPAVALIDLMLEGTSGLQVVAEIKKRSPATECIMLTEYVSKDSAIRAINLGAYSYFQKPYDPEHLLVTISQAIKKHETEEKLRESEGFLRRVIDCNPNCIFVKDKSGKYLLANKKTAELFGTTTEKLVGSTDQEFTGKLQYMDKGYKTPQTNHQDFIESNDPRLIPEQFLRLPDGSNKWVQTTRVPFSLRDSSDCMLEVIVDITERKRAEEELWIKNNAIASSINAIMFTDLEGNLTYVNDSFLRLWAYNDTAEVLAKTFTGFWDVETKALEVIQVLHESGSWIGELAGKRKNGSTFPAQVSASIVTDKNGKPLCLMGSIVDITKSKRLEEELIKSCKLESIGLLAGGIAHDFNNILTVIVGGLALGKMYLKKDDHLFEIFKEIEKAVFRARNLTQRLLTFSRGEAPVKKTVSIDELIQESARFILIGSKVKCRFSISANLWPAEIDEGQINQVINNLIINSIQALPEGGIIDISADNIQVTKDQGLPINEGRYIKISVRDQGKGITQENLPRIFDPYFTTKKKGNGLGLATSYSIIKTHGGHITAKSEVGVGTTFYIYLPASQKEILKKNKKAPIPLKGKGKILVMDDDETVIDITIKMLEEIGYEVAFARDGAEALELYKTAGESGHPFNAAIMDLTIPGGMGGKEAVKRLYEIDPGVKAIIASGYANNPVMVEFRKYNFCGAIVKPYQIDELNEVLHEIIGE